MASSIHTNVSDRLSMATSYEVPIIHNPAQSGEVCDPQQSIELSSITSTEVETVAQSLKRLECLIQGNTETQKNGFTEIKRRLSANFDLANKSIALAHESLQKAKDAISLAEDIKNDTRGLGEMDASNKTLLARLKDLLLGLPWLEAKRNMTDEKGLSSDVADKIGEYLEHKDVALMANPSAKGGISDMDILFTLLQAYKVLYKISFNMSLACGLDYYTGIIYEAIVEASAPPAFATNATESPAPSKLKPSKKAKADDGEKDELDELHG
ncbi:hypothetical protein EDB19DRAFT_1945408 [Suillus lakei]|nr:hypothetical protein EDB19DRAFT_1945408 [Suillus lakei]